MIEVRGMRGRKPEVKLARFDNSDTEAAVAFAENIIRHPRENKIRECRVVLTRKDGKGKPLILQAN